MRFLDIDMIITYRDLREPSAIAWWWWSAGLDLSGPAGGS